MRRAVGLPWIRHRERPSEAGLGRYGHTALSVLSILAGLLIWELVGRYLVTNPLLFVPFSDVLRALVELFRSGEIWKHLRVSAQEFALGFALAAVAGILGGFLLGVARIARSIFDPWISALYATPLVALMPFYLVVFGIGVNSKAALVFTVSVFPILINTTVGVRATDRAYLEVGRAFGARNAQLFTKVYLPASLPFILSGLRLGLGRGLVGVVVGEFFFSSAGLGYLVARSSQSFRTDELLAGIVLLAVMAVALTVALERLERRLAPWRQEVPR